MADFNEGRIEIRYNADNWGPYEFDFEGFLPESDSISAVTIRSFVGNLKPSSDMTDFVEIPADLTGLIDTTKPPVISVTSVLVYFRYPGSTYKGEKVTLVFQITTEVGAVHAAYFQYVYIQ